MNAIKLLKNGKAAGPDNIPVEALKTDLKMTTEMLYPLFKKIWEEEEVPTEWMRGTSSNCLRKTTSEIATTT